MKTDSPLVSVIIPLYNEEDYLQEAIDSILAQTYGNFELIIVDDGSTDRSGEIADSNAEADERIRVIHTENSGSSHARNTGIEAAMGEWIMFIDADDLYMPDSIETMLRHSDNVDAVCCGAEKFPEKDDRNIVSETMRLDSISDFEEYFEFFFGNRTVFRCAWAKLYRRSALKIRYDESIRHLQDEIFNISNMMGFNGIAVIPDVLYKYRVNHRITSSTHFWMDTMRIRVRHVLMWWHIFPKNRKIHSIVLNEFFTRFGTWISELNGIDSIPAIIKPVILEEELRYITANMPEFSSDILPSEAKRIFEIIRCENCEKILKDISQPAEKNS